MIFGVFLFIVGLLWLLIRREQVTLFYSLFCLMMGIVSTVASVASEIGQLARGEMLGVIAVGVGTVFLMLIVATIWRAYFLERVETEGEQR